MTNKVELIGFYGSDEIRDIAATMLDLVKNIKGNPFKYTIEAFDL